MVRKAGKKLRLAETYREAALQRIFFQARRVQTQEAILAKELSKRSKLTLSQLRALDFLHNAEKATTGDLAKATGVVSGAVTIMIEQLEMKGYVTRGKDRQDGRRVVVRLNEKNLPQIQKVYLPATARLEEACSSYSDAELALIEDFLTRTVDLAIASTEDIKKERWDEIMSSLRL